MKRSLKKIAGLGGGLSWNRSYMDVACTSSGASIVAGISWCNTKMIVGNPTHFFYFDVKNFIFSFNEHQRARHIKSTLIGCTFCAAKGDEKHPTTARRCSESMIGTHNPRRTYAKNDIARTVARQLSSCFAKYKRIVPHGYEHNSVTWRNVLVHVALT